MKHWLDGLDKDDVRRRSASPRRAVFELRHVLSGGFFGGAPLCAENQFWFRAVDPLPTKPLVHYSALAYASDYGPMATAILPHGKAPVDLDVRLASIDHSMWFHREANLNDKEYFVEYHTAFAEVETTFLQSKKTNRWWMQLPDQKYIACSYQDYLQASSNEVPERWLRALER